MIGTFVHKLTKTLLQQSGEIGCLHQDAVRLILAQYFLAWSGYILSPSKVTNGMTGAFLIVTLGILTRLTVGLLAFAETPPTETFCLIDFLAITHPFLPYL
jgi:hypothetical protein